jgi:hypothetical protein
LLLVHAVREEQEQEQSMLHQQQNGEMKKKSTTVVKKRIEGDTRREGCLMEIQGIMTHTIYIL